MCFWLRPGINSLGLALLSSHKFHASAPTREKSYTARTSFARGTTSEQIGAANAPQVNNTKIASLLQPARPIESQQGDVTFDVNSFNF